MPLAATVWGSAPVQAHFMAAFVAHSVVATVGFELGFILQEMIHYMLTVHTLRILLEYLLSWHMISGKLLYRSGNQKERFKLFRNFSVGENVDRGQSQSQRRVWLMTEAQCTVNGSK